MFTLNMMFFRKRMEDGTVKKAPMHEPKYKWGYVHEHQYVCELKSEHKC